MLGANRQLTPLCNMTCIVCNFLYPRHPGCNPTGAKGPELTRGVHMATAKLLSSGPSPIQRKSESCRRMAWKCTRCSAKRPQKLCSEIPPSSSSGTGAETRSVAFPFPGSCAPSIAATQQPSLAMVGQSKRSPIAPALPGSFCLSIGQKRAWPSITFCLSLIGVLTYMAFDFIFFSFLSFNNTLNHKGMVSLG